MSGSGRETLPGVREWSVGHPGGLGVLRWPSWMSGMVGRPSRFSRSGRETLPNFLEWSRGPPGCPGVVERSSRMSGSGW